MRSTALLLIASLLWSTTFAPLAAAASFVSKDVRNVRGTLTSLMDHFQTAGWRIENAEHQALSTAEWMAGGAREYSLVPPPQSRLAQYVFHVRAFSAPSSFARFAISVSDPQGRLLVRRLIQVDAANEAAAERIRLEETLTSIESALQTHASAQPRTWLQRLHDWIEPSARAEGAEEMRHVLRMVSFSVLGAIGLEFIAISPRLRNPDAIICAFVGGFAAVWGIWSLIEE